MGRGRLSELPAILSLVHESNAGMLKIVSVPWVRRLTVLSSEAAVPFWSVMNFGWVNNCVDLTSGGSCDVRKGLANRGRGICPRISCACERLQGVP